MRRRAPASRASLGQRRLDHGRPRRQRRNSRRRRALADAPADALVYEDLIAAHTDQFEWPDLDERQASGLCYTSGTTGNPKGVLYGHRSTVLHAMALALPDAFDFSARDVVMPCAQMYHANAWCTPYAAPLVGATLVLPGRALDGASIAELIQSEGVSFLLGVPTIWVGVADHLDQAGRPAPRDLRGAGRGGPVGVVGQADLCVDRPSPCWQAGRRG